MNETRTFQAWWVDENGAALRETSVAELGDGDTLVSIEFSGINYKDGLALGGRPGVLRSLPMIPGIDLVGTVVSSESGRWSPGERVLVNGGGLGETFNGGLSEFARVPSEHLVRVPESLTNFRAAAIGTAGFTAMLSVLALEDRGVRPDAGPVLVTGAGGGVGSIAVSLLSGLGYEVIASTGRAQSARGYFEQLGAHRIIDRSELSGSAKPLQSQEYAAVVDSVGSHTLVNALSRLRYGGVATTCGMAQGSDLPGTVLPFILRGVSLEGINSVFAPMPLRERAWQRLSRDLQTRHLDLLTSSIPMSEAAAAGERILRGELRGRTVVDVEA